MSLRPHLSRPQVQECHSPWSSPGLQQESRCSALTFWARSIRGRRITAARGTVLEERACARTRGTGYRHHARMGPRRVDSEESRSKPARHLNQMLGSSLDTREIATQFDTRVVSERSCAINFIHSGNSPVCRLSSWWNDNEE